MKFEFHTDARTHAHAHAHRRYLVHTISFPDKWIPSRLVVRLADRRPLGTPFPVQEHSPVERVERVFGRQPIADAECRPCCECARARMSRKQNDAFIFNVGIWCCNWHLHRLPVRMQLAERSLCHQFDHSAHGQVRNVYGRINVASGQ